jgi:hypothetical protein
VFVVTQGMLSPLYVFQGFSDLAGWLISAGDLLAALQALTTPEQALYLIAPGGQFPVAVTGYNPNYVLPGTEETVFLLYTSGSTPPAQTANYTAAQLIKALTEQPAGVLDQMAMVPGTDALEQVTGVKVIQAFAYPGQAPAPAFIGLCTSVEPPRWPGSTGQFN